MKNVIELFNCGGWADWSFNNLDMDFENVVITISGESDNLVKIYCKDYIGFYFVGHWDESIIEDIRVETVGSLIDESLKTVKKLYGEEPLPGGGVKKINDIWYQLNVKLIDRNVVKVACKNIEVDGI